MDIRNCAQFLQWSLPMLHMRWQGFRKVRGQVCKRIARRLEELNLADLEAYRSYLQDHGDEWQALDSFCRITITRFYRDTNVYQFLERDLLPELCRAAITGRNTELYCWSLGCASGQEPYSLALLWDYAVGPRFPQLKIRILATDADRRMIERAEDGCYDSGRLKGLPEEWISRAFVQQKNRFCIRQEERDKVDFCVQDVRMELPREFFDLILCRNLVFTYFEEALQKEILGLLRGKLTEGGALVIGIHESLPPGHEGFEPWPGSTKVYRKVGDGRINKK